MTLDMCPRTSIFGRVAACNDDDDDDDGPNYYNDVKELLVK